MTGLNPPECQMLSPRPRQSIKAVRTPLLLAFIVSVALSGLPALPSALASSGSDAGLTDAPTDEDITSRSDSKSASSAARASGHKVEDISKRSEFARVFANPDGSWTADVASEPVSVRDTAGEWRDIDTTLVKSDAGWEPSLAPSDLRLSGGGDQTFATMTENGHELAWNWPTILPAPTVSGDTATFAGAAADGAGDLVVTATATGFTHDIVLHRAPERPLELATSIDLSGQGNADIDNTRTGGVQIATEDGKRLAVAPKALMWDSSGGSPVPGRAVPPPPEEASVAPVPAEIAETGGGVPTVTMSPDQDFLTSPSTVYPVVIDPSYVTGYSIHDTWVASKDYTSSQVAAPDLRTGTNNSGDRRSRSFLTFSGDAWKNSHIISATLSLYNFDTLTCSGWQIKAQRINEKWDPATVTWTTQPDLVPYDEAATNASFGTTGCSAAYVHMDLTNMVQKWASGTVTNYGIGLRATTETGNASWRRYYSTNYTASTDRQPHLIVSYDYPQPDPPMIDSAAVQDGEISEPLPPSHAFRLSSDEVDAKGFYVSRDSAAEVYVPATQGLASYAWAPGYGQHKISATTLNKYGIRGAASAVDFAVRERIAVDPGVTALDVTLAANQTADIALSRFTGGDWPDVDTFAGSIAIAGWTNGQAGSISVADGQDIFPPVPNISWQGTDSPATGRSAAIQVAPGGDSKVTLRNASTSGVRVKLVMTSWLREIADPDNDEATESEEDPESEEDAEGVSLDGEEPVGDELVPGVEQCFETGVIDPGTGFPVTRCRQTLSTDLIPPEQIASNEVAALTETKAESAAIAPSAGYDAPLRRACKMKDRRWGMGRFVLCRRDYGYWVDKVVNPNTREKIVVGELWAYMERKAWMGYLTKRIDLETRIYRTGATGTFDKGKVDGVDTAGVIMSNYCDGGCSGEGAKRAPLSRTNPAGEPLKTSFSAVLGTEDVDDYRLETVVDAYSILGTGGGQPPIKFAASPLVRCDDLQYIPGSGCRVVAVEPRMIMRVSNARLRNAAIFYRDIQYKYGWGSTKWFTRASLAQKKANRAKACSGWVGPPSCDEFPFAFTLQGCATESRAYACNRRGVPLKENKYAGSLVGAWLGKMRILRNYNDEQFYFVVRD